MKDFKIIYGMGFAGSIACLFYTYHYFQVDNNPRALMSLVINLVCAIVNFIALVEEQS